MNKLTNQQKVDQVTNRLDDKEPIVKLIIEITACDWDDSDAKRFCDLAKSDDCTYINVEIGGPHQRPKLADEGVAWIFSLGSEYFKARVV